MDLNSFKDFNEMMAAYFVDAVYNKLYKESVNIFIKNREVNLRRDEAMMDRIFKYSESRENLVYVLRDFGNFYKYIEKKGKDAGLFFNNYLHFRSCFLYYFYPRETVAKLSTEKKDKYAAKIIEEMTRDFCRWIIENKMIESIINPDLRKKGPRVFQDKFISLIGEKREEKTKYHAATKVQKSETVNYANYLRTKEIATGLLESVKIKNAEIEELKTILEKTGIAAMEKMAEITSLKKENGSLRAELAARKSQIIGIPKPKVEVSPPEIVSELPLPEVVPEVVPEPRTQEESYENPFEEDEETPNIKDVEENKSAFAPLVEEDVFNLDF